ncbi:hypothetical protein [Hoeflea sp. IMCC20628]|uniref:hypothetical protein n=1 Tax=Hoeflea sp. IMCC20628 TaxID=1620421 RepID=UPI0012E02C45|nr:hypothetical protein [Hoeflea sp. IMCC20628]
MTSVVSFVPSHGGKSYWPEFVLFEDRKRRQWAVIEREPDGTETAFQVYRGRKSEAAYMANMYTRLEAMRQKDLASLARDPLGQTLLAMTPDQRRDQIRMLTAVQRLVSPDYSDERA